MFEIMYHPKLGSTFTSKVVPSDGERGYRKDQTCPYVSLSPGKVEQLTLTIEPFSTSRVNPFADGSATAPPFQWQMAPSCVAQTIGDLGCNLFLKAFRI